MTGNEFTIYELSTGEIFYTIVTNVDSSDTLDIQPGYAAVRGRYSPLEYYIYGGVPLRKLPFPYMAASDEFTIAANGIETVTISGIPTGTDVVVNDGLPVEVNDGVVEFSTTVVKQHKLLFSHPDYLDKEVTIYAD